jgi:hypothetical protein
MNNYWGFCVPSPRPHARGPCRDYDVVLKTLGRQGDYKANVLKINIPRNDVQVTIDCIATPAPFGFGGWLASVAKIAGTEGEQHGQVYKTTIGRDDLNLKDMGATINARMGLNSWAAFYSNDSNAQIAGDIAMLAKRGNSGAESPASFSAGPVPQ